MLFLNIPGDEMPVREWERRNGQGGSGIEQTGGDEEVMKQGRTLRMQVISTQPRNQNIIMQHKPPVLPYPISSDNGADVLGISGLA